MARLLGISSSLAVRTIPTRSSSVGRLLRLALLGIQEVSLFLFACFKLVSLLGDAFISFPQFFSHHGNLFLTGRFDLFEALFVSLIDHHFEQVFIFEVVEVGDDIAAILKLNLHLVIRVVVVKIDVRSTAVIFFRLLLASVLLEIGSVEVFFALFV